MSAVRGCLAHLVALLLLAVGPMASANDDPFAAAHAEGLIGNVDAGVPPQCYTRTGSASNPCWACHTTANGRNLTGDWEQQARYDFSEPGKTNHWTNLFQDRRPAMAKISDAAMLAWVRRDNVTELHERLARYPHYVGWRPDLAFAQGFDRDGFARDGSGWRAIRYKPFVGTFWPTNGSTDDIAIRLPESFRQTADGQPSLAVYRANLAILEAAVAVPDTVADGALARTVETVDEAVAGADLDGNGRVGGQVQLINRLPAHFAGGAAGIAVHRYEYPLGTEFFHGVRYLDPDAPEMRAARFKELRYAVKRFELDDHALQRRHADEVREQKIGDRPHYEGNPFTGQSNAFGWRLQGFIEDADGQMRLQTREEQLYCMGCHTGLGVTVDETFSLPRKLPGAAGWGLQSLLGQKDVPQSGSTEPEYLRYLRRVGAGDEFRANREMLARFFPSGRLDVGRVRSAAPGGPRDLRGLILPSRARALALDKAYKVLVDEQSFRYGRDAVLEPAANVYAHVDNGDSALKAADTIYQDGRIWPDWGASPKR